MDKVRSVLVDLSGTIHVDDRVIPGALEAISRLRKANVQIKFVTNTTKESKHTLLDRLTRIGFDIKADEVFTSLTAARQRLEKEQLRPLLLLEQDALKDFDGLDTENPNAVVVGLAPSKFNYDSLNEAFRLLQDGCYFIAIHKARYYKRVDGLALGPGAFVSALEYASGRVPELIGKPEPRFFEEVIEGFRCSKEATVMIGDDVRDDVGGAQSIGMRGILVKTGKYRDGDELKIDPPPFAICKDIAKAVDHILPFIESS